MESRELLSANPLTDLSSFETDKDCVQTIVCEDGTASSNLTNGTSADSLANATNLGTISSKQVFNSFTVSSQAYFTFTLPKAGNAASSIQIDFQHSSGDLDLYLCNTSGGVIDYSLGVSNSERISLYGVAAGTYQVVVQKYSGTTAYQSFSLTIDPATSVDDIYEPNNTLATASNLGTITSKRVINNLVCLDNDYYKFTISRAGDTSAYVQIDFTHSLGDIDLVLYNSAGTQLNSSLGITNTEKISLSGYAAGTYYVRVYSILGHTNPSYSLTINPSSTVADDIYEPNNTLATASNLGTITAKKTIGNLVSNDADYYKFTLSRAGDASSYVQIDFQHTQGDLDLHLYDSSGTRINYSMGVTNSERISLSGKAAGTYYILVQGYNGVKNPSYSLTINPSATIADDAYEPNNTFATAANLGTITSRRVISNLVSLNDDYYKFTLSSTGDASSYVQIDFQHYQGDLDLYLYNSSGTQIKSSLSTTNTEKISLSGLAAGTYTVRVRGFLGVTNPSYSLTINPPVAAPSTPTNFRNTEITSNSARFSWNASSNATGYDVWYKRSTASEWSKATVTTAGCSMTNMAAGTTYYIAVRAKNSNTGKVSAWSQTIAVTTPVTAATRPAKPANFAVKSGTVSSNAVTLKWSSQSNLTGYTLQYKQSSSSTWLNYSTTISGSATEQRVTGLTTGTSYDFRLVARNNTGNSDAATLSGIQTTGSGTNYAVLFAGGWNPASNHTRYYDNVKDLYSVLTTSYGLSKSNIYVIYADGTSTGVDRADGRNSDMSFALASNVKTANYANLNSVFTTLGGKMTANDHLLFYTFDHGGDTHDGVASHKGGETLTGWYTSIAAQDVAKCVEKIQYGHVTMAFAQCFAGGILDNIIDPSTGRKLISTNAKLYGMSATNHYEPSYGDGFSRAFINAIDPRKGNRLTTTTAFSYAKTNDQYTDRGTYSNNAGAYVSSITGRYIEHPWGIGDNFSIFVSASGNSYEVNSVEMNGWNDSLVITNTRTSTVDAMELTATDPVFVNFAFSNPLRTSDVFATVTVFGDAMSDVKTYELDASLFTADSEGNGRLTSNFNLGTLMAGTYMIEIELLVGGEVVVISRAFEVHHVSTDIAETLQESKKYSFDNNRFETVSRIGDGKYGVNDVDIYQFTATAADIGKTFSFNTIASENSTLPTDTYLRLFNSAGEEIVSSIFSIFSGSSLYHTIATAGTYFLAVSSLANTAYNPLTANSGNGQGTIGEYRLTGVLSATRPDLSMHYDYSWIDNIVVSRSSAGTRSDSNLTTGDTIYVNYRFQNAGYASAAAVKNRITITGPNGYTRTQDFTSSELAAGGFQTLSQNFNWGKLAAGTYTIRVTLDVDGTLTELNEGNNVASFMFTVDPGTVVAPPSAAAVTTSAGTTVITWGAAAGATRYDVMAYNSVSKQWSTLTSITGTSYSAANLASGVTMISVHAVSAAGRSEGAVATVLRAPLAASVAVISANSTKMTWNAANGATGYEVLAYHSNTKQWSKLTTITGTTYTAANLSNYVTTIAIHAVNAAGRTGGTTAPVMGAPAAASAAVVSATQTKLTWNKANGATKYDIVAYNSSTKQWSNVATVTGTAYTATNLAGGVSMIAIHAVNAAGRTNGTTASVMRVPAAASVAAVSATQTKLTWNKANGATKYDIVAYNSSTKQWSNVATVTGTTYTATNLSNYVTTIAIHAVNAAGRTGGTTASVMRAPAAASVAAVSATQTKLTWNKANGATAYDIMGYNAKGKYWWKIATVSGTSYTAPGYSKDVTMVAIHAVNAAGRTSGTAASVMRAPAAASAIAASATQTKLSWNAVSGATSYDIMGYNAKGKYWWKIATVSGTSYTAPGYSKDVTMVAIHAVNAAGRTSGTAASVVRAPSNLRMETVSSTSARFSWSSVGGATRYELVVYDSATKQWKTWGSTAGTSYLAAGLPPTVTQVSIHAVNAAGRSAGTTIAMR